jgi:hypothetical protein
MVPMRWVSRRSVGWSADASGNERPGSEHALGRTGRSRAGPTSLVRGGGAPNPGGAT